MDLLKAAFHGLDEYLQANPGYPKADVIRARSRGILRAYVNRYGESDRLNFEVIGVEELGYGPILNPSTLKDSGFIAAGKKDVILFQKTKNKRSILDHKILASEMDDHHHKHLMVDTQPLQYAYLQHLDGETIDSAIWDVIAKTSHKPKVNESINQFEERMFNMYQSETEAWMEGDPEAKQLFSRKEVPISPNSLASYAQELYQWTSMLQSSRRSNTHLKSPEACFNYHRPCRYLDICAGTRDLLRDLQSGALVKIDTTQIHAELNLPAGIDPQQVITNSRLKTYRTCQMKHDLQYNLGIRKANEVAEEPLFVGSAMHAGLEHYFNALKESK